MTNEELQAIRTIMQEELQPVKKDIENLKEDMAEIRSGVNTLLEWADKTGESITFPLPKIAQ